MLILAQFAGAAVIADCDVNVVKLPLLASLIEARKSLLWRIIVTGCAISIITFQASPIARVTYCFLARKNALFIIEKYLNAVSREA